MTKYYTKHKLSSARAPTSGTAGRLLDGLVIYRAELGETGRQLENLLRINNVVSSFDVPYIRRTH
jgi:hypothetical protein